MNVAIRFPSATDVVTEEVTRFRALAPEQRVELIRGIIRAGTLMMQQSPKAEFLRQSTVEQENLAARTVKEFISRHAL